MNKVFKVIWSDARSAYVVVSEIAKNHGSKSSSTKKLLAMLIATGVMTCASFDVLAAQPAAETTAAQQYVALKAADFPATGPKWGNNNTWGGLESYQDARNEWNAQKKGQKTIGNYTYTLKNKYWVRDGYVLTVDENGGKYTPLSANKIHADVAYTKDGVAEGILQSVTSTVSASGTVTNMGDSLNKVTAGSFAGVSHSGGTEVAGSWNYIIHDPSWEDVVDAENYKDGYVDLIGDKMPKGFITADSQKGLVWDNNKQAYIYKGQAVDYSNVYVIDGHIGVFTDKGGNKVYTGTVYGKNNEILMTVKDKDNNFYSYWAAEVTDPSATMATYRVEEYNKNLAKLVENDDALYRNDIKEVTLTKGENSATIGLMRNGDKAVDGAITVTSGGGTGGSGAAHDTFVKISNGKTEQNFATGSKVEAIVDNGATTGIKINGQDYTIKSGSVVSVVQTADKKTTTITVDGTATNITDTTYTEGDGIEISGANAISVSKNLTGMQSITGAGTGAGSISFEGSNVKVNQNTFNSDGRIQGVVAGTEDTDAVNVAQLKKVSEAAASASQGWKLKTQNGNASDVKPGATVEFDGDANIQVGNDGNKVSVTLKKQLTGIQSITGEVEGAGSISFANDGIKFNNKVTIDNTGKISGVADGKISTDSTDAVNGSQLHAVATEAGKHTTLSNGKNTTVNPVTTADGHLEYKVNVAGDLTDITSVANGDSKINLNKDSIIISNGNKYFAITNSGIGMSYIGADYSAKSIMLGENGTTISGGLNVAGSKITGVAAGVADTDAVNVGQLNAAVQAGNTDTHIKAGEYGVGADNKVNMDVVDKNGNKVDTVTIKDVAKASDVGNVNNIADDIKNGEGHTTVVDAVNNLNNKVGDLQYSKVEKGDIADGDSTTTAIGKLDQKLTDVAATAAKHTKVEGSSNITVTNTAKEGEAANYKVELNKNIDVDTVTANSVTTGQTVMNNDGLKVGENVSVTGTAVTAGQASISNEGLAVGPNTSLKADELKVDGKNYIDKDGLNANGQHITNVKAGEADTDAVNYGQLKDTNNHIDRVENQVVNNTNRISNLDNRVNKVGAGAAALAALHPLDFDPDAKWDFAAGYGNYRGANAAAVGAYYRPNEDTMFSVGGTFGNGENMVNVGVSFKLGSGSSHVSTSRVAMAKEIKELRGELEAMKSAMLDANAGKKIDTSKLQLFPDVPQNHWAYEYVAQLAGDSMIEGYPDGNFAGDRPMTRYEFAAILYRAMTKGAVLSDKILSEFSHELEYFTVDTIAKDKAGNPTIQRVRIVKENKNK